MTAHNASAKKASISLSLSYVSLHFFSANFNILSDSPVLKYSSNFSTTAFLAFLYFIPVKIKEKTSTNEPLISLGISMFFVSERSTMALPKLSPKKYAIAPVSIKFKSLLICSLDFIAAS